MNRYILPIIALFVLGISEAGHAIEFSAGLSAAMPVGGSADLWTPGPEAHVTARVYSQGDVSYDARLSFFRWTPAAAKMLTTNGLALTTDRAEGDIQTYAVSAVAKYSPELLNCRVFGLSVDGGVGVYYLTQSTINVYGFRALGDHPPFGNAALNREIHKDPKDEITAGLNAGVTLNIADRIRPSFSYRHIFSDEGNDLLLFGVTLRVY